MEGQVEQEVERDLERRSQYLEIVLEHAPDAIVTLDANHRIIDWNRGASEIFGFTREEVEGRNVDDLISGPDRELEARGYTEKILSGERIPPVETVRYRKDGTPVDVLMSGSPIIVEGRLQGVIAVYTDITDRKRYESELLRISRMESVGTLAGGIAHDFNNLLSGIFGNISLISKHIPDDSPARKYLNAVIRSMDQAVGLTHQLLTFAKGSKPVIEALDTADILVHSVRFNLAGSSIKAHFDLPDDLWMIRADSRQLGEVITNLVINAKEAMQGSGELYVGASNTTGKELKIPGLEEGDYIRIDLRDTGSGIDERHLGRIFEPFYSTKQEGSGLGLAVVHSIVSKHGGHTLISLPPEGGTCVTIILPAQRKAVTENTESKSSGYTSKTREGRILVMDDEDYIREVAGEMLKALGHRVDYAGEGSQALELYADSLDSGDRYDLVILDLTVPGGMDGKTAASRILQLDRNAVLVVSSGYSSDPVMADHKSYGFSGVLAKPYMLDEMATLIHELLN